MNSNNSSSLSTSQKGFCSGSEDWMPQTPVLRPSAAPSDAFSLDDDDFRLPESVEDAFSLDSAESSSFCAVEPENRFSLFESMTKKAEKKVRSQSDEPVAVAVAVDSWSSTWSPKDENPFYKALERGFLKLANENAFIKQSLRKRSEQFSFKMI